MDIKQGISNLVSGAGDGPNSPIPSSVDYFSGVAQ